MMSEGAAAWLLYSTQWQCERVWVLEAWKQRKHCSTGIKERRATVKQ